MKHYLQNPTSKAFLLSNLICCPFFGVFALLPMILCKELQASSLQISTMTAIKPLTALFASYWSSLHFRKSHYSSLKWGYLLKFLPFVFLPFLSNTWAFVFAFGIHMLLLRGVIPSWMETLKRNLSHDDCGKVCSIGSSVNYLCTAFLPILFGWVLDAVEESWRWAILSTSILGMGSVWLIVKYLKKPLENPKTSLPHRKASLLSRPWKNAHVLLSKRPDFFHFQVGFFLGGAGLMVMHAIIPKYFTETLQLSYTQMFLGVCFCKGIGFSLSSPIWVKIFNRSEIFSFCSIVPLVAVIFPLFLILAKLNGVFLFFAYFLYGIMQSGSELGWKMSGPIFAKEQDSSAFSSINILAVGVRGAIFPYLGALLFLFGGPYTAFACGALFCLFGSIYLWKIRRIYAVYTKSINNQAYTSRVSKLGF